MKRPRAGVGRSRLAELHAHFLSILPRVELHGRIYFRHLRPHQKADAVQEMRGLACYADLRIMRTLRKKSSQARDLPNFFSGFQLRTSP